MAYIIYFDGEIASDSAIENTLFIDPVLKLVENEPGEFTFTMPPLHPSYDDVQFKKTEVRVNLSGNEYDPPDWCGFVSDVSYDFMMNKKVTVTGDLACLKDTLVRPKDFSNGIDVSDLMADYIRLHNDRCHNSHKQFVCGGSTEEGILYCYTDYNSPWDELQEDVIEEFGGHFVVKYSWNNDKTELIKTIYHEVGQMGGITDSSNQIIQLGENLLDLAINFEADDICTAIVPLGRTLKEEERTSHAIEGQEEKLTIRSVNDDKDYLINSDAISTYGYVWRVVKFDDVKTAKKLLRKGKNYLTNYQFANMIIRAKAIDLGLCYEEFTRFQLHQYVTIKSTYHGMNTRLPITEIEYHLEDPGQNIVQCGKTAIPRLSSMVAGKKKKVTRTTANGEQFFPSPSVSPGDEEDTKRNSVTVTDGIMTINELANVPTVSDGIMTIN